MVALAKIVLLGDGAVGKTSIKMSFIGEQFSSQYLPTIGADFVIKKVTLDTPFGKEVIKFQIWDIAGQPAFQQIRKTYYSHSVGCLLVFDTTRSESLKNLKDWMQDLYTNAKSPFIVPIVIGNKIDLRKNTHNNVTMESAQKYISEHLIEIHSELHDQITYIETSAKTGTNINRAFQELGTQLFRKLKNKSSSNSTNKY
ncbi:MAG: Rab family GTPase [Candidatus Kariarchaeaceae archaeon]|jgi:small GTP-binding protein